MLSKRKLKNRPKSKNWRSKKAIVRDAVEGLHKKGYFENCNYQPCKVTKLGYYGLSKQGIYCADVEGDSLVDEQVKGCSCSILHCNAFPLTEKEAFERRDFWLQHGEAAYWHKYVYIGATLEQVQVMHAEFVKVWR